MAAATQASYKIKNWREYNESLVQRGSITFWFDEEVIENWKHRNEITKVGRPYLYSDVAVECLLMLRELFRLPYRQTEGLGRSLVELMQIDIDVPDFTSLAKRAAKLNVGLKVVDRKGPIDVVDPTEVAANLLPGIEDFGPNHRAGRSTWSCNGPLSVDKAVNYILN